MHTAYISHPIRILQIPRKIDRLFCARHGTKQTVYFVPSRERRRAASSQVQGSTPA
jgi:hypothetical protein